MIFITGDTHSDFRRFSRKVFPEQREMTKDDTMIIAGDFGGVWHGREDWQNRKAEDHNLDELEARSFTTVFVPGNHENYARLMSDEFPEKRWNGGRVKEIRPSVLMLMRGEMYEIDGCRIFAFGGASSHDIKDGILDGDDPGWKEEARRLNRQGKYYFRVKGISWWPEELPSEEEMQHGRDTLEDNGWYADYVITHCASTSVQTLAGFYERDVLTDYLDELRGNLDYKRWFFGHYHDNRQVAARDILIYEQMIRVW